MAVHHGPQDCFQRHSVQWIVRVGMHGAMISSPARMPSALHASGRSKIILGSGERTITLGAKPQYQMSLIDQVRLAGVVGAGGGGFPAHVKLASKAEIIIANGAECEPLLHKDAAVMEHYAAEVVRGVELCMAATGAGEGVIGIKAKKKKAVAAIEAACQGTRVRVQLLGDFYPAGDEYDLVYTVTGKLIPPGGLPIHVGAVVSNVETLVNIARACPKRAAETCRLVL